MIWLSKLIILLVVLLVPGVCLAANAVPGYVSGHPVVYAITPDGAAPLGDPEAETGATAFEPQVLSSWSACEALSDNTNWVTAGSSVFCMPCDSATATWSSGVSDTTSLTIAIIEGDSDCFLGMLPEELCYPDYSSGASDMAAYIFSGTLTLNENSPLSLYVEGVQFMPPSGSRCVTTENGLDIIEFTACYFDPMNDFDAFYLNSNVGNSSGTSKFRLWNSIIHTSDAARSSIMWIGPLPTEMYHNVFYRTIKNSLSFGVNDSRVTHKNNIVFGLNKIGDDFEADESSVSGYNACDDPDGPNSVIQPDWSQTFDNYQEGDWTPVSGATILDKGVSLAGAWTDLMGVSQISTDMAGTARSGVSPEIGPFEITAAAPAATSVEEPTQWQMLIGF